MCLPATATHPTRFAVFAVPKDPPGFCGAVGTDASITATVVIGGAASATSATASAAGGGTALPHAIVNTNGNARRTPLLYHTSLGSVARRPPFLRRPSGRGGSSRRSWE